MKSYSFIKDLTRVHFGNYNYGIRSGVNKQGFSIFPNESHDTIFPSKYTEYKDILYLCISTLHVHYTDVHTYTSDIFIFASLQMVFRSHFRLIAFKNHSLLFIQFSQYWVFVILDCVLHLT